MSEDSKVDNMSENSSQLGRSAPLTTLDNQTENSDVSNECSADQRTANGDSASEPPVIVQLLRMLRTAKARHSGNLHSTEESSLSRGTTISEDPSTDEVR